ncbi:hypothetical protein [Streptomyces sp. NRRL B-1140]|nr:hypothetical protein [Streptomyces sp. NRRL B-1140]
MHGFRYDSGPSDEAELIIQEAEFCREGFGIRNSPGGHARPAE